MKKFLGCLMVILICICLVACGGENLDKENNNDTNQVGENESSDGYFEWNGTEIIGYTDLGRKQIELTIPAECTIVRGLKDNDNLQKLSFEIANRAFQDCTALMHVILPENITVLESATFKGCTSLKNITIPENVEEIMSYVFEDCTALEEINFGKNVKEIGSAAFCNCSSLKELVLPESLVQIGKSAFENCLVLEKVQFVVGLEIIEKDAFRECDSLTKVVLPEGLLTLKEYAFGYCNSLEEIYLPNTLESIHAYSLVAVTPIKVYVVEGSYMDKYNFNDFAGGIEYYEKHYQE